jgi:hypothetical protein
MLNELYTFLSIILVPATATLFLYLYKSKCSNVKLCYGLVEVERDVRDEVKSDMASDANRTLSINSV